MELYSEILAKILENQEIRITFPNMTVNAAEIVEGACYKALYTIKAILEDDNLSDPECFQKIEEIICLFEFMGSNGGNRHDFG